ncbi:hypothetical protein JRQ81_009109 [Phrynocephalus forsythii]|uniref:Uncharacterized protein n=1 Tax=Phrynocephalus forsythii TaxID=171643 RepID=A0A9Q0XCL3_9SAUR|nr:hypothetical protein JRQ81_009109 [Phrynocephalus forsythii]
MAMWKFPSLATLALTLLAMPSLLGERAGSKLSCGQQQQVRYRKPPLDTLPWPGYWVPLMIILGGCCGLAWCILYLTYNISQRGGEDLPQLPSKAEEPATPLDGQKAWSRTLFQADTEASNMETGNSPWLESTATGENIGSRTQLENKFTNVGIGSSPWLESTATGENIGSRTQLENKFTNVGIGSSPWLESTATGENIGSRTQLENKFTNVGIGSSPWLENNLPREPERSIVQLERKATSKRTGIFTQQLECNIAAEKVRSFTHFESNALSERAGGLTPLENNQPSERIGSTAQLESLLANERTGSVTQLENKKISTQPAQGGPAFQEASEPPSQWPGQDGEENGRNLWNFMEKELEKLLGALRLHRSSKPALPEQEEEETPDLPSEEPPAPHRGTEPSSHGGTQSAG